MSELDKRLRFIESEVEKLRKRWSPLVEKGALTRAQLDEALAEAFDTLLLHPVGMELVARAMPRDASKLTEERGLRPSLDAAVGDDDA